MVTFSLLSCLSILLSPAPVGDWDAPGGPPLVTVAFAVSGPDLQPPAPSSPPSSGPDQRRPEPPRAPDRPGEGSPPPPPGGGPERGAWDRDAERGGPPRGPESPDVGRRAVRPDGAEPPMMPERGGHRGPGMEPGGPPLGPLPRLLADRRPDLAERLERLRSRAPRRFAEVLVEVLLPRLEEALTEAEQAPDEPQMPGPGGPDGLRPPRHPGPPGMDGPERFPPEAPARLRELLERDGRLEARSRELAEALRPPRVKDLPADKLESMRAELNQVVKDQFDVRSELRKAELQRLEHELDRIRELLERTQRELERRERERDTIIENRQRQLLGDDASGW